MPDVARLVGVDLMEAAVELAREASGIEAHVASADQLPFRDAAFDLVLCQHNVQQFGRRAAVLREGKRVLRGGGRAWFSVWSGIDDNPDYAAIRGAWAASEDPIAAEVAGSIVNGFWEDGAAKLDLELADAGFSDTRSSNVRLVAALIRRTTYRTSGSLAQSECDAAAAAAALRR